MSNTVIPHFTQSTLLQPYCLARGSTYVVPTTIDLTAVPGAYLSVGVGIGNTTNFTQGIEVLIRTLPATESRFGEYWSGRSTLTAVQRLINNGSNYAAGTSSFAFDGSGGTNWSWGDWLCFWATATNLPTGDAAITPAGSSDIEFLRAKSTGAAGTPLLTAGASIFGHVDNEIFSAASVWPDIWLAPGSIYELVFDSSANAAGDVALCYAVLKKYDYDLIS